MTIKEFFKYMLCAVALSYLPLTGCKDMGNSPHRINHLQNQIDQLQRQYDSLNTQSIGSKPDIYTQPESTNKTVVSCDVGEVIEVVEFKRGFVDIKCFDVYCEKLLVTVCHFNIIPYHQERHTEVFVTGKNGIARTCNDYQILKQIPDSISVSPF